MAICSDQLRRYYWAVVIKESSLALIDAGYERERFSHPHLVHMFWKTLLNVHSTADLTNKQFSEYIEDIQRICAEYLHWYIPDANTTSS